MFVVLSLSLSLAHSLVMPEIEQNGWPPNYSKSSAYLQCLVALFSVMYWSSIYCSFLMLFEVSAPMHFQVSHITCPNQETDWVRVPQYEQNRSALPMPLQLLHSWLPHPQSAWCVHQMASILGRHYAMKQLWNHAKFEAALLVPYGTLACLAWCDVTTHSCHSFRFVWPIVAGTCCWAAHSLSGRGGCLACHLPLKNSWSLDKLGGHCHDSYWLHLDVIFSTHRIHGAAIYGNIHHQYTPFMLAYIPAPWILWGIKSA